MSPAIKTKSHAPPPRNRGGATMRCPKLKCRGLTRVLRTSRETRSRKDYVIRHRTCTICSHEFRTEEEKS